MSGSAQDNKLRHIKAIVRMRLAAYLLAIAYMRLMKSIKGIWQDNDGRVGTAEDNDSDSATSAEESFDIVVVDVTTPNAPKINEEDTNGVDEIRLRFAVEEKSTLLGEIFAVYHVKNNSNTDLAEVLKGEAVFTIDVGGDNHKGKTTGKENKEREFDFVQKMINHIVPPLRTPVMESNLENTIDVDGLYGAQSEKIVKGLITGGDVAMSTSRTITLTNDLKISHHIDGTDDPKTFKKLAKDYTGIVDFDGNTTELDHPDIGKVIDKEILVGLVKTDDEMHPTEDDDIGIYELYFNEHCIETDPDTGECTYSIEDWDQDGISNYVEVENSKKVSVVMSDGNESFNPTIKGTELSSDIISLGNLTTYKDISVVYSENDGSIPFNPLKKEDDSLATELLNVTRRGTYGHGELLKNTATVDTGEYAFSERLSGLRIPNANKGYYYYRGIELLDDPDNYALLSTLQKIERVGKKWAELHPDLAPLTVTSFPKDGGDNGLAPIVVGAICDINPVDGGIAIGPDPDSGGGIRFGVGDLSRIGGGFFYRVNLSGKLEFDSNNKIKGDHNSHQSGTDVDVRYVRREACGEGRVDFDGSTWVAYDRELTFELMSLFAQEGAQTFFVDDFGRAKIFSELDEDGNEIQGIKKKVNFNGRDVEVNREGSHNNHFHVKFPDPYVPRLNTTLIIQIEGYENQIIPSSTTVTIQTDVIRDDLNWALMEGTLLRVTTNDVSGKRQGTVETCTDKTSYWLCSINSNGSLKFGYSTTGLSNTNITISVLSRDGANIIGSKTINVQ